MEPETPDTSEPELVLEQKTISSTVVTRSGRKRAAEDDADVDTPHKRRVIAPAVVVKAPQMRASRAKARVFNFVSNIVIEPTN